MSARDHVTIHQMPGSRVLVLYCGHCTGALHLAMPMKAAELVSATEQFANRHKTCEASK